MNWCFFNNLNLMILIFLRSFLLELFKKTLNLIYPMTRRKLWMIIKKVTTGGQRLKIKN